MFNNLNLRKAPQGFVPDCQTWHNETAHTICQSFFGGRVKFIYDKTTGEGTATANGRTVGCWNDITVGMWSDILYTLSVDYDYLKPETLN